MGTTDHRIPVKADTHKALHDMKIPGQTYDELLTEMIAERRRREAAADIKATVERADDIEIMHELMQGGEFEEAWDMMGLSREEAEDLAETWYDTLGDSSEQQ